VIKAPSDDVEQNLSGGSLSISLWATSRIGLNKLERDIFHPGTDTSTLPILHPVFRLIRVRMEAGQQLLNLDNKQYLMEAGLFEVVTKLLKASGQEKVDDLPDRSSH
jgi:hypothetical protein